RGRLDHVLLGGDRQGPAEGLQRGEGLHHDGHQARRGGEEEGRQEGREEGRGEEGRGEEGREEEGRVIRTGGPAIGTRSRALARDRAVSWAGANRASTACERPLGSLRLAPSGGRAPRSETEKAGAPPPLAPRVTFPQALPYSRVQ